MEVEAKSLILMLVALGFSATAGAQLRPRPLALGANSCSQEFSGPRRVPETVITGKPFTAVESTESRRVAPARSGKDAPVVVTKYSVRVFRDSEGRGRAECPGPAEPTARGSSVTPTVIALTDPVEGYEYIVDVGSRVAHRLKLPAGRPRVSIPSADEYVRRIENEADNSRNSLSTLRSLGMRTIEGLPSAGQEFVARTQTSAGDVPSENRTETWYAPELGVPLIFISITHFGVSFTTRLVGIRQGSQDPSLFRVPASYAVVDETGPFTMAGRR